MSRRLLLAVIVFVVVVGIAVTVYATTRTDSQIDRNRIEHIS